MAPARLARPVRQRRLGRQAARCPEPRSSAVSVDRLGRRRVQWPRRALLGGAAVVLGIGLVLQAQAPAVPGEGAGPEAPTPTTAATADDPAMRPSAGGTYDAIGAALLTGEDVAPVLPPAGR